MSLVHRLLRSRNVISALSQRRHLALQRSTEKTDPVKKLLRREESTFAIPINAVEDLMSMDSESAAQKPHHDLAGGRFQNIWGEQPLSAKTMPSFKDVMKWWMTSGTASPPPAGSLPLRSVDVAAISEVSASGIQLTWIGHSSFLVQLNGLNILTDPVWSTRASPISFMGPKRLVRPAMPIASLPSIDAVVISHNHYDHLDVNACRELHSLHPECVFYVPLGLKKWFVQNVGKKQEVRVQEMDWWESVQHTSGDRNAEFTFCPAQHWSSRTPTDRYKTLWGSWLVQSAGMKYYFTGDTGYCPVFKEIGAKYGPIDVSCIPIGAYEPRWIMQRQHVNPEEALQIHEDLQSRRSVGMHWGTFILTAEPVLEPPQRLQSLMDDKKIDSDAFVVFEHGETRAFE